MFVCASSYYKMISGYLGDDFVVKRGRDLKEYLDAIN